MYKYPIYQPDLSGNEKLYVNQALDSGWISSKGEFIEKFTNKFSEYLGVGYTIPVFNGTVALHLALDALGINQGDEVIVPTFTYIASVNAIKYVNATPVFVDSDPTTLQICPESIKKKITSQTKAIIVVHLYGHPADMGEIMKIAKEHKLLVIEDCAESLGAKYKGKHTGTFGDAATFSFFGNKTITTGEGGMVVFKDPEIYKLANKKKGQGLSGNKEYWHDEIGYNYRMTNLQAAIGLAQIERIDEILKRKREIAQIYYDTLNNKNDIRVFFEHDEQIVNSFWMCSIIVKDQATRDKLREYLKANGVETRPGFYPVHTMPMYSINEAFEVADDLAYRVINLPSWPGLKEDDIKTICKIVLSYGF